MNNNGTTLQAASNPFAGFSGGLKVTLEDVAPRKFGNSGPKEPLAPVPEGKYDAYPSKAIPKVYGTGAAGIQVTFDITTKELRGRRLTENFILVNKVGEQSKVGLSRFVRLLQAAGLTKTQIENFKVPSSEHDMGDLAVIINKDLQIQVKADGEYQGKPRRKVAATYPAKQQG